MPSKNSFFSVLWLRQKQAKANIIFDTLNGCVRWQRRQNKFDYIVRSVKLNVPRYGISFHFSVSLNFIRSKQKLFFRLFGEWNKWKIKKPSVEENCRNTSNCRRLYFCVSVGCVFDSKFYCRFQHSTLCTTFTGTFSEYF